MMGEPPPPAPRSFLNARRLGYAWIAGVILWCGWLVSLALGPGNLDLVGHVVGTDYLEFYAAGMTVRLGEGARLYDIAYQAQLQQTIIGPQLRDYYGFITPPFLAWLFAPLSALPYLWSFALWSVLGLAALWLSLRLLAVPDPQRTGLWVLMFFPVFAAISYGQNSLLSLLLLSLVYSLWRRGHGWMAGLTASLLLYKPQLIVGVALLWLLEWLWPAPEERGRDLPLPPQGGGQEGRGPSCRTGLLALLGLSVGGGLLIGMCFWLMPEASRAYVTFARTVLPDLPAWQEFPLWNLHSIWGFWRLLLPNAKAWADRLYWFSTLVGIAGFAWVMSRLKRRRPRLLFAAAISLTLWATPHAMIYDWALLLIPAILLWQDAPMLREQLRPIYALIWIAAFISGPLTRLQLGWLPLAVQIGIPAMIVATGSVYWWLLNSHEAPDH